MGILSHGVDVESVRITLDFGFSILDQSKIANPKSKIASRPL
jgi:hypothetical protein